VQRALKLKARREARLKKESVVTPEKPNSNHASPTPDQKEFDETILHPRFSPSASFPLSSSGKLSSNTSSDVDFSPSTGVFDPPTLTHPIPSSSDNGATLDWSGTFSDDGDKRWVITMGKKRDKNKLPPLRVMIDQQEQIHKGKPYH
jgi:hypothetical protein